MKFATMHLMANVGNMVLRTIENCGPHVDAIYVGYSPNLWGYVKHGLKNMDDPDILKQSKWYGKVRLVEGTWTLDEEERNAVRTAAIKDGMDVLIIQDTDEFYEAFGAALIDDIREKHNCQYYLAESVLLWKNLWRLYGQDGKPVEQTFECAIDLHCPETTFKRCRRPDPAGKVLRCRMVKGIFHHAAYCRTPEQMWAKCRSWGHAHQIKEAKRWYDEKWHGWTPETRHLHYDMERGSDFEALPYDLPPYLAGLLAGMAQG